jgi:hypothetical protein
MERAVAAPAQCRQEAVMVCALYGDVLVVWHRVDLACSGLQELWVVSSSHLGLSLTHFPNIAPSGVRGTKFNILFHTEGS